MSEAQINQPFGRKFDPYFMSCKYPDINKKLGVFLNKLVLIPKREKK